MGLRPRLVLRRRGGRKYLTRWGWSTRFGGIFLHRMDSADPGVDLHDHPWPFLSVILRGYYVELTSKVDEAVMRARLAERFHTGPTRFGTFKDVLGRGMPVKRTRFNWLGLGRAHRIVVVEPGTLTLVFHGPRRRDRKTERSSWGFFTRDGWVDELTYAETDERDIEAEGRTDR